MIIKLYYKHCSHPIVLGASTLGLLDQPVRCHTSLVRGTCASTPREAADVLSAHVRSLLDRDREGDRRRQLPIVGNDLLGHGITHLLLKMLVTFHQMLKIKTFSRPCFDLVNVDAVRSKLAMTNSPILLAGHSLVLHLWHWKYFLLRLLGWWLLQVHVH